MERLLHSQSLWPVNQCNQSNNGMLLWCTGAVLSPTHRSCYLMHETRYVHMRYVFCFFSFNFLIFWPHCAIHGILVLRPGIEPTSPALEVHRPNHWTPREVWGMWYFYRWENWDRRESSNLPKPQRQVLSGRTGIQSMSANRTLPRRPCTHLAGHPEAVAPRPLWSSTHTFTRILHSRLFVFIQMRPSH